MICSLHHKNIILRSVILGWIIKHMHLVVVEYSKGSWIASTFYFIFLPFYFITISLLLLGCNLPPFYFIPILPPLYCITIFPSFFYHNFSSFLLYCDPSFSFITIFPLSFFMKCDFFLPEIFSQFFPDLTIKHFREGVLKPLSSPLDMPLR